MEEMKMAKMNMDELVINSSIDPKEDLILMYVYQSEYMLKENEFIINELELMENLAKEKEQEQQALKERYVSQCLKMKQMYSEQYYVLHQTQSQLVDAHEEIDLLIDLCHEKNQQIQHLQEIALEFGKFRNASLTSEETTNNIVEEICAHKDEHIALLEKQIADMEKEGKENAMLEVFQDLEGLNELCCYKDEEIKSLKEKITEMENQKESEGKMDEAIKEKTLEMLVQQHEAETKRLEETIILLNDENEKLQDSQKIKGLEIMKANEIIAELTALVEKERSSRKENEKELKMKICDFETIETKLKEVNAELMKANEKILNFEEKNTDQEFQIEELKVQLVDQNAEKISNEKSEANDYDSELIKLKINIEEMKIAHQQQIEQMKSDVKAMQDELEDKIQSLNADNDDLIAALDQRELELKKFNNDDSYMLKELQQKLIEKDGVLARQKVWIKSSKSVMKEAKESSENILQEKKKLTQRLKDKEFELEEMKLKNEEFNQVITKKDEKIDRLNVYLENRKEERREFQAEYDKKEILVSELHKRLKLVSQLFDEQISWKKKYVDLWKSYKNTSVSDETFFEHQNELEQQTGSSNCDENDCHDVDIWSGLEAY